MFSPFFRFTSIPSDNGMLDEIESKTKGFDNMRKMRMLSMLLALLLVFSLSLSDRKSVV